MLITAQRIGSAVGIAAVGTSLVGSGSGGKPGATMPHLVSTAQVATVVGLVLGAFSCGPALPRTLGTGRAEENRWARGRKIVERFARGANPLTGG